MTAGVLVLAAGRARRFGSDKRLARLPDGRRSIDALLDRLEEELEKAARQMQCAGYVSALKFGGLANIDHERICVDLVSGAY